MPSPAISASFEQLALPLLPSATATLSRSSRNHGEAEDLVQETISKALRAFDSFQPGTNFKAWIFRILRNTFLTSRTGIAASRTVFLEDHPDLVDITDAGLTPEDHLIRLNNQAAVNEALDQLQPPLREVLLLCDVEELKYKDIALVLDVPIGTVMSRISRARSALYRCCNLRQENPYDANGISQTRHTQRLHRRRTPTAQGRKHPATSHRVPPMHPACPLCHAAQSRHRALRRRFTALPGALARLTAQFGAQQPKKPTRVIAFRPLAWSALAAAIALVVSLFELASGPSIQHALHRTTRPASRHAIQRC